MPNPNPYLETLERGDGANLATGGVAPGRNPYLDQLEADEKNRNAGFRASASLAVDSNPDQVANARKTAGFLGVPPATVEAVPVDAARQAKVQKLELDTAQAPTLRQRFTDYDFARVAHDDSGPLSAVERAVRSFINGGALKPSKASGTFLGASALAGTQDLLGVAGKLLDTLNPFTTSPQEAATLYRTDPAGLQRFHDSAAGFLPRFVSAMSDASERTMRGLSPAAQESYGKLEYATLDPNKAAYLSPIKVAGDAIRSLPTSVALGLSIYLTKSAAAEAHSAALVQGLSPELARQAGIEAAKKTMAQAGAITEGLAGYAQQANQTVAELSKLDDEAWAKSPKYQELLAQGHAPEAARQSVTAQTGEQAGFMAGIVDAAVNHVGGQFLGKILTEGGRLLPRVFKGGLNESLTEFAQSAGEQFGQNLATQKNVKPGQDLFEGVLESAMQGLVVGGVTGGTFAGFVRHAKGMEQSERAIRQADQLSEIFKLAAGSKLRERDPESFAQFVQAAAEETNSSLAEVHIDATTLGEVLNQSGVSIEEFAKLSPTAAEALAEAQQLGGSVAIPIGDLTGKMTGTGLEEKLLPHLRAEQDGLSQEEAKLVTSQAQQVLNQEGQRIVEQATNREALQASADKVHAAVLDQLTRAKRFTADVNGAYASLVRDFYTVVAATHGTTPEAMYARYPLHVTAQGTGALRQSGKGAQVMFEVAPDPNDAALTSQWKALPAADKLAVSQDVAAKVVPKVLEELGTTGQFVMQTGGYLGDTNPSMALRLADPAQVVQAAKLLGHVLSQDSMMVVSEAAQAELKPISALTIALPKDYTEQQIRELYDRLWKLEHQGEKLIGGHSTSDGQMVILNYTSLSKQELAKIVDEWLGGEFVIATNELHAAFIEEYGYDSDPSPARDTATGRPPVQGRSRDLRDEATALVREALAVRGKGARGSQAGSADGGVDPPSGELGQGTRGTFDPKNLTIGLLENADLSTFLHETGHAFLEMLADMAAQPGAPAAVQQDMQVVLDWFGVADLATWHAMTLDQQRPYHEKFAESFEQYLFEGKAPSRALVPLFQRFRSWLTNVYKSLSDFMRVHNTQLSDEVRGVFDRMLATDDQIEEAQTARKYEPLFQSADAAGMTPEQWAAYQNSAAQATTDAVSQLQRRSLRDLRWVVNARGKALTAISKDVGEKRKATEAEVRAEVVQEPVYAAQRWLKTGVMPDGTLTVGAKLSTEALREMYGDGPATPWRYLATNMVSASADNSLHPDQVAEMFGYDSGDALVRAIIEAFPEESEVQGRTDRRLLERYGDLATPQGLARAADDAVHNEARARFVATELRALQESMNVREKTAKGGSINVMIHAAKQFADQLVARRKVRDLKPAQHSAAETRAAARAAKASATGKTAEAVVAKRDQLLNFYAAKSTVAAIDEVDKGVKYLSKIGESDTLPPDYQDQINKMLERFDLRRSTTLTDIGRRAALLEWVETQRDIGIEPDIPAHLLDEAQRKSYKEMTVEEFRGLVDTVKQIAHLGKLKDMLLTSKAKREFTAARDAVADSIIELAGDREADTRTPNTVLGESLVGLKKFWSAHIKVATWARVMDGGKDGGAVWEYLVRPANFAGDREITMRAQATKDLTALVAPLLKSGKLGGKGKYFPSITRSLNREAVLAIALNSGNESNLQRLLGGEGWSPVQIQPVLASLTAQEWHFVQAIWDYFEGYRPEIAAKERRVSGREPEWLEAVPRDVQTADGKTVKLKGGYYPVKYDTRASERAESHADAEAARAAMKGAYTSATTRRSFTKTRAEEVKGRPLLYSLDGIYNGVTEVIHDLAWHEFLIDANRLVKDKRIASAMREHYGPDAHRQFKTWLEDVAQGDAPARAAGEQALSFIRQGVSVSGLGLNVMSALVQPLGATQSIVRIGAANFGHGLMKFMGSPLETVDEINEKSAFMATRNLTRLRELAELRGQVKGKSKARQAVDASAYFLMLRAQQLVDVPTWWGGYEKAIIEGNDEDRAVALADQAVIDSQGSGTTKDQSAIERGGPGIKLFTTFYSFFNTALNLGVGRTMTHESKAKLAADYLMLYTVPVILGVLLKDALTPGDSGDDDPKKLAKKFMGEQLGYLLGLMFGVREITSGVKAATGTNEYATSYAGPAGLRPLESLTKLGQQVHQGELDDGLRKQIINVAGTLLRLPAAQINRSITGAQALAAGKTHNPAAVVMGFQEPH